jgi:RNA polymerase-binding transcription factor DksA
MALMPKKAANNKKAKAAKTAVPAKKAPAKKPVAKKAAPKAPAKKPAAKKAAAKAPAKKKLINKTVPAKKNVKAKVTKSVAIKKIFGKPPFPIKSPKISAPGFNPVTVKPGKNRNLGAKFLSQQKKKLVNLREHMIAQMQGVTTTNLRSSGDDAQVSAFGMHQADAGSDAYEKDFALNILSQEQDALYEINAAIKRIEDGSYGVCEMSGQLIPLNRLEAIPFARFTIECQSQIEKENKGKHRWDTSAQFMDSVETFYEEEEPEEEDPDKLKE